MTTFCFSLSYVVVIIVIILSLKTTGQTKEVMFQLEKLMNWLIKIKNIDLQYTFTELVLQQPKVN